MTKFDTQDRPDLSSGLKILIGLCAPAKKQLYISTAMALVATVMELAPFFLIYRAVKTIAAGEINTVELAVLAALAAVLSFLRYWIWAKALEISHIAAFDIMADLRMRVATKLASLPLGWFNKNRSGKVQRVLSEDIERLELLVAHSIPELVSAVVFWLTAACVLIMQSPKMGLAALIVAPVAFTILWSESRSTSDHIRRITAAGDALHGHAAEVQRYSHSVRLYDKDRAFSEPLEEAITEAVDADVNWSTVWANAGTAFRVLINADFIVAAPLGAWLVLTGQTSQNAFLLVMLLAAGILQPLERIYHLGFRLSWISYSGATVDAMLNETALEEPAEAKHPVGATVRFEDVNFSHDTHQVLDSVSFVAQEGKVTALVGPSGAGKSTALRLIGRFWDIDSGTLSIGGVPVHEISTEELFSKVSFVFQAPFLFKDTVAANLRVANPDASDEQLIAACKAAQIHDVIEGLEDGYDTVIADSDSELSGGEQQRLTIARAILRDSEIVLLDESTAMTDPDNEAEIQSAIGQLGRGRCVVVIAHRLRTVVNADSIVVFDNGKVVETGTHSELLENGGTYFSMWNNMLSAEAIGLGS